jgi:spoIIIJ-associated protein
MQSIEAEGHSIDDAIERALQRLGVTRDKVDIEIVSNASRGLFGFGGQRAKVRATLRRPLNLAEPPEPVRHPAADSPARPAAAAPLPPPRPAPRQPPAPTRSRPQTGRRESAAARPPDPAPRRVAEQPQRPVRPAEPAAPLADAVVEHARTVLAEIVRLTGSSGTVEVVRDPDCVRLVISGDPSGLLIGRRGQTLDALEYLLHRVVSNEEQVSGRLIVDAGDYRLRRRQALEQLTDQVAERARRGGKPLSLSPMSPRDRRIVHLALQGDPTLTTRSAGTGFYRKVVIVPAGARRGSKPKE